MKFKYPSPVLGIIHQLRAQVLVKKISNAVIRKRTLDGTSIPSVLPHVLPHFLSESKNIKHSDQNFNCLIGTYSAGPDCC